MHTLPVVLYEKEKKKVRYPYCYSYLPGKKVQLFKRRFRLLMQCHFAREGQL